MQRQNPTGRVIAFIVHQDDRAVFPGIFYLSIHHLFPPFPEIEVIGYPPLKGDVGEFLQARQFGYCYRLVIAHAVVNRIGCGVEPGYFPKAGSLNTADLNSEFKSPKRIVAFSGIWHVCYLLNFYKERQSRHGRRAGALCDANYNKFHWHRWRQPYFSDNLSCFPMFPAIGFAIALDVKCLFGAVSFQRTLIEQVTAVIGQTSPDTVPKIGIVGFVNDVIHVLSDPPGQCQKQASHIDICPLRLSAQRSRSPDANSSASYGAQTIDSRVVQLR